MKLIPLFDRVLLLPETEQVSGGGIYLPQSTAERSQVMTVASVGDGICDTGKSVKMAVCPGDRVVVHKYAGTEIVAGGQKHYIVKQCDILAVIK